MVWNSPQIESSGGWFADASTWIAISYVSALVSRPQRELSTWPSRHFKAEFKQNLKHVLWCPILVIQKTKYGLGLLSWKSLQNIKSKFNSSREILLGNLKNWTLEINLVCRQQTSKQVENRRIDHGSTISQRRSRFFIYTFLYLVIKIGMILSALYYRTCGYLPYGFDLVSCSMSESIEALAQGRIPLRKMLAI